MRPVPDGCYVLDPAEIHKIDQLLMELAADYFAADDPRFLAIAPETARALPANLVRFVRRFHTAEQWPHIRISGLPVAQNDIGPTPRRWPEAHDNRRTIREDLYLILLGALLGEVFGWSTLQRGALIHTVVPAPEAEHTQSGQGSKVTLDWHIEDAFHPNRCDYIGLFCLRNPDHVATTVASVEALESLSPEDLSVLREPRFLIRPDDEHLRGARDLTRPPDRTGPAYIEDYEEAPEACAVLFGSRSEPYLRINPPFMRACPGDEEAERALRNAVAALDRSLEDVPLAPGETLFIDNYRCIHGRRSFVPRYDGQDRWLRKTTISRDLRASRAVRQDGDQRIIR